MGEIVKPIRPSEVVGKKQELLPDGVLIAFNRLIAENWNGYRATISLPAAKAALHKELGEDWPMHYLDVEDIYRNAGWSVKFDKPGYNESYTPTYEFTKKKK